MKLIFFIKSFFESHIILRYLFSGGSAALINISLLYFFTDILGLWYLTSGAIAFLCAFMVSFLLQKFWTFRDGSTEEFRKQSFYYFSVQAVNLLINLGLLYVFVDVFGVWHILAQVISSGLIAIESFVIYKFLIFNRESEILCPQK